MSQTEGQRQRDIQREGRKRRKRRKSSQREEEKKKKRTEKEGKRNRSQGGKGIWDRNRDKQG